MRFDEKFSERLLSIIKKLDKKKSEFAKEINVSPGNLSDWLSGRSQPDGIILIRLNEKFGINIDWLMTGKGELTFFGETNQMDEGIKRTSDNDIGRRLKDVIRQMGFKNILAFSRKTGVNQSTIYALIRGQIRSPGAAILEEFHKNGINTNWLITGEGEPTMTSETNREVKYSQPGPAGERLLDQEGQADTHQEIAQKLQKTLGHDMREKPVQTVSFNRQDVFNLVVRAMLRMEQEEIYEIKVLAARLLGDEFERSKTDAEREKR